MKKEIKLIFIKDKNNNNNREQKSIFPINSERNNNQGSLLGKKRKNSKDQKLLSISRPITHCIHRTKINDANNNNLNCPICLQMISFADRHSCHCGHIFHCDCINKWINSGNNICPVCRQNLDCTNHLPEEPVIALDEDENQNNYNNINNDNYHRNNNNIISSRRNNSDSDGILGRVIHYFFVKYLIGLFIFFMFYFS